MVAAKVRRTVADERLDPYREGVAELFEGERPVGYLLLRGNVVWSVTGPLWRRREEDHHEVLDWMVAFTDQRDTAVTSGTLDGAELADALSELRDEEFLVGEELFRLVWLRGPEAAEIRADYGWPGA